MTTCAIAEYGWHVEIHARADVQFIRNRFNVLIVNVKGSLSLKNVKGSLSLHLCCLSIHAYVRLSFELVGLLSKSILYV